MTGIEDTCKFRSSTGRSTGGVFGEITLAFLRGTLFCCFNWRREGTIDSIIFSRRHYSPTANCHTQRSQRRARHPSRFFPFSKKLTKPALLHFILCFLLQNQSFKLVCKVKLSPALLLSATCWKVIRSCSPRAVHKKKSTAVAQLLWALNKAKQFRIGYLILMEKLDQHCAFCTCSSSWFFYCQLKVEQHFRWTIFWEPQSESFAYFNKSSAIVSLKIQKLACRFV